MFPSTYLKQDRENQASMQKQLQEQLLWEDIPNNIMPRAPTSPSCSVCEDARWHSSDNIL